MSPKVRCSFMIPGRSAPASPLLEGMWDRTGARTVFHGQSLYLHSFGAFCGVDLKGGGRKPAVHFNRRVASDEVVAARLEKLLLDGEPRLFFVPEMDLGELRGDV